ncbi:MAG TPA: hypothetical protein VEC93_00935, partial [Anaerolineae bacterium]|nr:hypothetical protein [Anaerolineae bacterium]
MPEEIMVPASTEASYESEVIDRWPELTPEPVDKRPLIYGIIAAVVIFLIFGGIGVWLFLNPATAVVLRDIFIIY